MHVLHLKAKTELKWLNTTPETQLENIQSNIPKDRIYWVSRNKLTLIEPLDRQTEFESLSILMVSTK